MIEAGAAPTTKPCYVCGTWKPLGEFNTDRSRKDGLCGACAPCAKQRHSAWVAANKDRVSAHSARARAANPERHRWYRYGMEPGEFDRIKDGQGGVCAICREVPRLRLVVDHNHVTGAIRGLLCDRCNHALHIVERPELLVSAISYLEEHSGTINSLTST